ncbi:PHP domain-containing protein [Deinococcus cellulosilyticus]|uniref:DNA polymerase/3'-5' exonuclease PolX n=1 Tax=Deinococcus cellulosilyticus (strain DSM 18568 / NBRC 106333 / KACC 11606 / 5516J-15) TaxID=1223518 RepID=A0A511N3Q3_DEIC1|nr:PHP domain-containing protein [Deinococcus cellulosilyticus]GEM47117.1 DNA polymerase/3'-5' exonuclease PolX [Deinococcus cellulosilyticus NBRC 106333 = KACC 11606]
MSLKDLIKTLNLTADLFELLEENAFRINSYRAAARSLESVEDSLEDLVQRKFRDVPKVGSTLAALLVEYVETGVFGPLEEAASQVPAGVLTLFRVRGLGPKKIRLLWNTGIESLEDLREACENGQIATLKGFGAKSQANILESVIFALQSQERVHMSTAMSIAEVLMENFRDMSPKLAGSVSRGLETSADVEITISCSKESTYGTLKLIAEDVQHAEGYAAWQGRIQGVRVEVGYAEPEVRGAMDAMFSGAYWREKLEQKAQEKGMEISSSGLKQQSSPLFTLSEEDVYEALELPHLPPEYREPEHEGLVLPSAEELITVRDIRGMLHVHSHYSDGIPTLRDLITTVVQNGHEYLGMGDHSVSAYYAHGLSIERLREQMREIDELRKEGFKILKGSEVDILQDGSLDYPDDVLAELDYVVASVHSHFTLSEEEQTKRLVQAVSHPLVTILGHPTGRLLLRRPSYALNLDAVLEAAAERGTVIEINANAYRLDLDWRVALKWRDRLKFAINTDAHVLGGLKDIRYGVAVARKAGLTPAHVINTLGHQEMLDFIQKQRSARS